ncbi:SDR family NAD(P)-dependent oxidoreductase [Histidinibacterium aquaticum]|nr:SDR family NAD(P)-dependent oxidoreductase [Histidinibacterium aquaticum]
MNMVSPPPTGLAGSSVVVTGGVGSVGRHIVRHLLAGGARRVRILDNDEGALFEMEQELRDDPRAEVYLCDVTDAREMRRTFAGMDYGFHLAALKHVPSCERSPFAALRTNIDGAEMVGRTAMEAGLKKVVFTSSDKAVNPTNVMGTSKLLGERLFTAMDALPGPGARTVFASTRFGNVLGSSGSVLPLFCDQIARGGPVTLTDARMTRFVMTMDEAAGLVIESLGHALGGEIFVTKMPVLRIADLARVMIRMLAPLHGYKPTEIELRETGPRPGEKLYEELSTEEEAERLCEAGDFLIVVPPGRATAPEAVDWPGLDAVPTRRVYHSSRETPLSEAGIEEMLLRPGVLPEDLRAGLAAPSRLAVA